MDLQPTMPVNGARTVRSRSLRERVRFITGKTKARAGHPPQIEIITMRTLKLCTLSAIGLTLLLLPLRLSSSSVLVVSVEKSSRKIRVITLVNGKPLEGVKIKIYRHNATWKDED